MKGIAAAQDGSVGTKANRPNSTFLLNGSYTNLTLPAAISGTSTYQFNAVSSVDVTIQRTSDSQYWNGSAWAAPVAWLAASGTSTWSYSLSAVSLTDLESYTIRSRATDSTSVVESTLPSSSFSYSANSAPDAPTDVAAATVATSTASLSWTDNSSGPSQETSFLILSSLDDSTYETAATVSADVTSADLTDLTANALYYFKVVASNTELGSSTSTAVTTTTHVNVPSAFTTSAVTQSGTTLTWSANGNTASTVYELLQETTSTWSMATTTATTYEVTGLLANNAYTFAIRALQLGSSPTSYSSEATTATTTLPDIPTAPSGLVFSEVANTTGTLSWTDNSSLLNQESAVVIYRSTDDVTYAVYATLAADTTSAVLTSLTPNTTYYFKVTASNVSGAATSTAVSTSTHVNAPTSFGVGTVTTSTVPLGWLANSNPGTTVYEILNQTTSTWSVATTTATSYTVRDLDGNTAYTFAVRAEQVLSSPTSYSSEVTLTTTTISNIPTAPTGLVLTNVTTSAATLSWTDNASGSNQETAVYILRSTDNSSYSVISTVAADTVTTDLTGLTPNKTYYFKVSSSNVSGSGLSDAVSTSTIVTTPASFSSGLATTSTVPLTWSANGNAAGTVYEVLNQTTSTWSVATTTAAGYTITGLVYDASYTFGLRAIQNASSPVSYSAELTYSTSTYLEAPLAPTSLVLTNVATSTATLSWTDNATDSMSETSMVVSGSTDNVTFSVMQTLPADTVTTNLTSLVPNTLYYFTVAAVNRSAAVTSTSVSTSTIVMAPSAFTATNITTSTVPLSWSATGNAGTTVYEVLNQTTSTWSIATTTATAYVVRDLESLTPYTFAIRALQVSSSPISYSAEAVYSTTTALNASTAPSGLVFSNVATSTLTLSWTDNASAGTQESSMVVSRSIDGISYVTAATLAADTVTTDVVGLTPNKTYYFKVTATNVSGSGVSSALSTSTRAATPTSFSTGVITTSTIALTWSANSNPVTTVYEVLNQTTSTWSIATTTATAYTVENLESQTSYTFALRALQNDSDPTTYSAEVSVTTSTALDAPLAPTDLTITAVVTSTLTLSWTDNASGGTQESEVVVSRSEDGVSYEVIASLLADTITTEVTGLTSNATYYFTVSAVNGTAAATSTAVSTSTIVMTPSAFTATGVTTSTVPLSWSANGNADGTIYEVLNQTTSTWSVATTTATSYTVPDLTPTTAYTFAVRALQAGSSPTSYSSEATFSTSTLALPPITPSAPSDLVLTTVTPSTLTLSWTDNASGLGEETSEEIAQSTDNLTYTNIATLAANATTTEITGLTPNTQYYFKVTATNVTGSATSTAISTSTIVMFPDVFTATLVTSSTIPLSWSANGNATGTVYEIRNHTTSTWSVATTTATTYTISGLDPGTAYAFGVRGIQYGNASAYSTEIPYTTTTLMIAPSAPTSLTFTTILPGSLTLSWTDNASGGDEEDGVTVAQSVDDIVYTNIASLAANATTTEISSLTPNTTYYFKVSAFNDIGAATSTSASTSTIVMFPDEVTANAVTTSTIPLIWSANGNATGTVYEIRNHTTSTWSVATTTATSYTVTNLSSGTLYAFGIRAIQAGAPTTYSPEIPYTTTTLSDLPVSPTAPSALVFSVVATSTLTLSWTDNASGLGEETSVVVSQSTDGSTYAPIVTLAADSITTDVSDLTPNKTYYFIVTATNEVGSATSTAVSTSTMVMTPSALTANEVTTSTVPLIWSANDNALGTVYEILNQTTSTWSIATTTAMSYSVTNLVPTTAYTFAVRALQNGSSPTSYSAETTFTTSTLADAPTAPVAPSALTLSNISTSTLTLSWTDNSNGLAAETEVTVSRSTDDVTYSTLVTLSADAVTTDITGLTPNKTYYFIVTVTNEVGAATSTAVSTSTMVMTPSALTANEVTTSTVPLIWSANGNALGTVYEVLNETTSTWSIATTTDSLYTVDGLASGSAFTFGVRAIQNASSPTTYSSSVTYTTSTVSTTTEPEAPTVPTAPSALSVGALTTSTLTLTWADNASGSGEEVSVVVSRSTDDVSYTPIATLAADATTTDVTDLTPNRTYFFKVTATNEAGSATSTAVSTSTIVMAPTFLTANEVTTSTVPLIWSANGNALGTVYEVLNETTSTWSIATTTDMSFTVSGLEPLTSYTFAVRGLQTGADSASYSAEATYSTTTVGLPVEDDTISPPTSVTSGVSGAAVTLTWTNPTDLSFASILIRRSTIAFPTSSSTGVLVASDLTVTSYVDSALPSGTYYYGLFAVNSVGDVSEVATTTALVDVDAPVLSEITSTVTSTSAQISWLTDTEASSRVIYAINTSYASTTVETDSIEGVTTHAQELTTLLPCATYHFQVLSRDLEGNTATSSDQTLTTSGCVGNAAALDVSDGAIATSTGGTLDLDSEASVRLIVPVAYADENASFQIKKLQKVSVINAIGTPSDFQLTGGDHVFDFHAFTDSQAVLRTFLAPIRVVMSYDPADIASLEERSFQIFRYDDGEWSILSGCVVDRTMHTVSCETSHFSVFALFGRIPEAPPVSSGGAGGGGGGSYLPVLPKPLTATPGTTHAEPARLTFRINEGALVTNSTRVRLSFNADPATVRGYAISLDPAFAYANLLEPYVTNTTFLLPAKPGVYPVYVRYFSTTGISSSILTQLIEYRPASPVPTPVAPPKKPTLFLRTLKQGDKGEDVKRLQQLLNANGCVVAKTGAGSKGKETTTFGPALFKAVKTCQEKNATVLLKPAKLKKGTGVFGELMRGWANGLLSKGK